MKGKNIIGLCLLILFGGICFYTGYALSHEVAFREAGVYKINDYMYKCHAEMMEVAKRCPNDQIIDFHWEINFTGVDNNDSII